MGYLGDKRYLETMQLDKEDCEEVRVACRTLIDKKRRESGEAYASFADMMYCLGEAMEYESYNLNSVTDIDSLFGDILLCLLDLNEYVETTSVVKSNKDSSTVKSE